MSTVTRRNTCADRERVQEVFPGLRCNRLEIRPYPCIGYGVTLSVSGSADDLIRHGFITARMIELLPPCGHARFGESKRSQYPDTLPGALARTAKGYRLERYYRCDEDSDDAAVLLRALGIEPPAAESAVEAAQPKRTSRRKDDNLRKRAIGRFRRIVEWAVIENVIWPNWKRVSAEAYLATKA